MKIHIIEEQVEIPDIDMGSWVDILVWGEKINDK